MVMTRHLADATEEGTSRCRFFSFLYTPSTFLKKHLITYTAYRVSVHASHRHREHLYDIAIWYQDFSWSTPEVDEQGRVRLLLYNVTTIVQSTANVATF